MLRIYTARGEALIHMTLTEAVELLQGGFQIHRSHWIHDGAVRDYKSGLVELSTGLKAAVKPPPSERVRGVAGAGDMKIRGVGSVTPQTLPYSKEKSGLLDRVFLWKEMKTWGHWPQTPDVMPV